MGLKASLTNLFISALVMALFWHLTEAGNISAETFQAKIIISFIVIVLSSVLSRLLGGK